jgi:hypothetical protein
MKGNNTLFFPYLHEAYLTFCQYEKFQNELRVDIFSTSNLLLTCAFFPKNLAYFLRILSTFFIEKKTNKQK